MSIRTFGRFAFNSVLTLAVFSFVFISTPNAALAAGSIGAITFNGTSTATVAPSSSVSVVVPVTLTSGDDWESTSYRIGSSGSFTCLNTTDRTSSGSNTISITAPATPGSYDVEIRIFGYNSNSSENNTCSTNSSGQLDAEIVANALTVSTPSPQKTVTLASVNGASAATVAPGATVVASTTVVTTGTGTGNDWGSTAWSLSTTPPGTTNCANTSNSDVAGTFSSGNFNITAPSTPGTYNLYLIAYENDSCGGSASAVFTLTNAVTVETPTPACTIDTAENKIENPCFETGFSVGPIAAEFSGNNWLTNKYEETSGGNDASFSIVGNAHSGTKAAQVSITSYTNGDAKWVNTPTIAVQEGEYYTFSFWYKLTGTADAFLIYNTDDFRWTAQLPPAATWTKYESSFLVPAGVSMLQVSAILASAGTLTTDDYSLVASTAPVFPQGIVSFSFDDGWLSQYQNALPILDSAGLKGTFYIVSQQLADNNLTGFMSRAQVKSVYTAGHEIGAHTRTHADLTAGADLNSEINGSKSDLESAAFLNAPGAVKTFAYPEGAYNDTIKTAVQNAGFIGARSVDENFNFTTSLTNTAEKYALKIQHVKNITTPEQIQAWIDEAVSTKTWLVLMFHDVANGAASEANCSTDNGNGDLTECSDKARLQSAVTYIVNSHICVQTVAQVLAGEPCVVNVAPVINAVADKVAPVGAELAFDVTATDTNNDTLTYALVSGPAGAAVTTAGHFTWTPTVAQLGATTTVVSVTDNHSAPVTTTINITVTDGAPVITLNGDAVVTVAPNAVYEDAGATANDTVDGDLTLSIVTTGLPVNTAVLGDHVITYSVTDSANNTASTTRTVKVVDADAPTISTHDNVTAQIDTTVASSTAVTYDAPTATDSFDGALAVTCTPESGSLFGLGSTEVTCSATDSSLNTVSTTFNVIVVDVNAPAAQSGSASTNHPASVEVTLVAVDNTVPAQTLTYSIVDQPTKGTLGAVVGDKVTYTPNEAAFSGTDSFTFKANDGASDSNIATITITINLPAVCADGYTQDGETCVSNTPTPACSTGYTFDGTECVPQTQAPSCPEGSTPNGAECEYAPTVVEGTPFCNEGEGNYVPEESKCMLLGGEPPVIFFDAHCAVEGAVPNGVNCETTQPSVSSCPADFTYSEGDCIPNSGNVAPACAVENVDVDGNCPPATTGLTCPVAGYTKLSGNLCLADDPVVTTPPASSGGGGGGGGGSSATYRVRINDNDSTTSSVNVTVKLTRGSDNATQVWLSNDANFSTGAWAPWSSSKAWTLTAGEGTKTVYVRFGRSSGSVLRTESDSIRLEAGEVQGATTDEGMTAEEIAALTTLLRSLGLSDAAINDVIKALGGAPASSTGSTGTTTVGFIFTQTLQLGSTGNEVVELQKVLIAGGYLNIAAPTGYFGPLTQAAVKAYQTAHGLPSVGIVGPLTRAALNAGN